MHVRVEKETGLAVGSFLRDEGFAIASVSGIANPSGGCSPGITGVGILDERTRARTKGCFVKRLRRRYLGNLWFDEERAGGRIVSDREHWLFEVYGDPDSAEKLSHRLAERFQCDITVRVMDDMDTWEEFPDEGLNYS